MSAGVRMSLFCVTSVKVCRFLSGRDIPKASKSAVHASVGSLVGSADSTLTSPLDNPFNRAALNLSHTGRVEKIGLTQAKDDAAEVLGVTAF